MAARLERFEQRFTYPLGDDMRFSLEHGPDYGLFYRALGDALHLVALDDDDIAGTVSIALRSLVRNRTQQCVWYIGDLKVAERWRTGEPLRRLAIAGLGAAAPRCASAFGVMMDGAVKRPDTLGRRTTMPLFAKCGELHLWSIPSGSATAAAGDLPSISAENGQARYFHLMDAQTVVVRGGDAGLKSRFPVAWLSTPSAGAVGRLEDTELAKRLVRDDGAPIRLAHLGDFAFADLNSAAALLHAAVAMAAERGFGALMVSMPPSKSRLLDQFLRDRGATLATATIFGLRTAHDGEWHVNSSEI